MKAWHVIAVCLLFIIIGFSIGKFTNKPADVILPDYSVYERREDSIMGLYKLNQDTINKIRRQLDSLKVAKVINHKQLKNDIQKIKGFNRVTRNRYLDSVYSADTK